MKTKFFFFLICFLATVSSSFGQDLSNPENISKAVKILEIQTGDSLKDVIKNMETKKLYKLLDAHGLYFENINSWVYADQNSKIKKYFLKKKISDPDNRRIIILTAFQQSILGLKINEDNLLKPYQVLEEHWAKEDKIKSTTDTLRGVYIPKDLDDCYRRINQIWSDSVKNKMRAMPEGDFIGMVYMGFGIWIINNWQLAGGSRLSEYFHHMGIDNPESISGIILKSYHRFINGKDIMLDEQIQQDKAFWEKSEKEDLDRRIKEFSNYKIGDTLSFNYNMGFASKHQEEKYDESTCIARGLILEKKGTTFLIKIKVLETCDRRGILYYNSEKVIRYNKKTKNWEKPKRKVQKSIKSGNTYWCGYRDWL